jgi:flagellar M-ring protein FliF
MSESLPTDPRARPPAIAAFWNGLGRGARTGLAGGVLAIALAVAAAGFWLLRTDYQVLFAGLSAQDAAAMVAELERMKVPYRLGDDGTSILVDRDTVHKTRLQLMGKELPLHGTVGFELFNGSDFGMTEFAQKINYQRALQGEITRTILSIAEVEAVRVHLALPEEGLFKRAGEKAKASITITTKPGHALAPDQVAGIQRLVAAAVTGVAAQDVTLVDQHGVALTRVAQADGAGEQSNAQRLDLKKETELYLARKVDAVLERRFGAGQAMASVDVTLDMDQVRVTTEDVVGAPARENRTATGVVVRERETIREPGARAAGRAGEESGSSQREVEYQVGRRVEQIVGSPGSVRRIHVAAIVRSPLDAAQQDQVRALLFAAVGGSQERGDVVVVQSLVADATASTPSAPAAAATAPAAARASHDAGNQLPTPVLIMLAIAVAVVVLAGAAIAAGIRSARRDRAAPRLTGPERERLLAQVRAWVAQDALPAPRPAGKARP